MRRVSENPAPCKQRDVAAQARGVAAHEHEPAGAARVDDGHAFLPEPLAARVGDDEVRVGRRPLHDVGLDDRRAELAQVAARVVDRALRRLHRGDRPARAR